MPIDPRIALMGAPIEYDTFGAMRQGQEIRQNQMTMQRAADARAALNAMRQPMSPAMQPGSAGPAITGGPLPSVNAMGAGAPMPAAVVAPAAPVNAARDMSTLYQFMDIPEVKNYVDEMNRQETARVTAAGRAIDDERLGQTASQQQVAYTIDRAMPMLARLTRDPSDENLDALAADFLSTPGINRTYAEQQIAQIRAAPPAARPALIADFMNVDAQGRAARAATFPDVRTISYGNAIGGMPNSDPTALTAPIPERAVALSAGQAQTQQNREEDRQRRLDDAQIVLDADAEAAQAEAAALAANPRADRDAVAAAQAQAAAALAAANANRRLRSGPPPRPAQTAPAPTRRRVYNQRTGVAE